MIVQACEFLRSLGLPIGPDACGNIAYSLASNQYVTDDKMLYFAAYWRVKEIDISALAACKRPDSITDGPLVYIVEAGAVSKASEMFKKLRQRNPDATAVLFHRRGVLKRFSLQKGDTV